MDFADGLDCESDAEQCLSRRTGASTTSTTVEGGSHWIQNEDPDMVEKTRSAGDSAPQHG